MAEDRLSDLYRRYGPFIYERCRRLLHEPSAAEDATQETFVRIHRHLDKAPNDAEALAWIYRVATNYCLNELRNQRLRPQPVDVLPEGIGANLEGQIIEGDLVTRLMSNVSADVRAVAFLHFFDGLDQGEVARILDISRRTVVNRLAEFKERSRALLAAGPANGGPAR
jgi:RNA polymerase sigma-70 factor (ECF subfamily)